jgi:hypothetical protein
VKPETFAGYAMKIAHGLLDEMILSVSISTDSVKVLTGGEEHEITGPRGPVEPPRLGHVGAAQLFINRHLEIGNQAPADAVEEAVEETADFGAKRAVPETQAPVPVNPQILQMLQSLRRAAWFVVCLLALIFIVTLLRR